MKLLKLLLLLIILAPVTFIAVLYFTPERIDFSKYQPQLEAYIQKNTGYKVMLGDNLKIQIFPQPHLSSNNVEVKSFNNDKPIFKAETVSLDLSLDSLFAMQLGLDKVLIKNPAVYLHRDINNIANWEPKRKKKTNSQPVDLSFMSGLGDAVISNAEFVYEDDVSGQQFNMKDGQFSISGEQLRKTKLKFSAALNSQKIEGDLNLDLSSLIETSVNGTIQLADNKVTLKGFFDELLLKPSYNGELAIEGENVFSSVYELLHIAPNQRGFNAPLKTSGLVDIGSNYIRLNNYSVQLEVSPTPVQFDVTTEYWFNNNDDNNTIKISANELMDLRSFDVCKIKEKSKKNKEFEWSEQILDFDFLKSVKFESDVEFLKGFICQTYQSKYFKLRANIESSKLKVTQLKVELPTGGSIRGIANLDVRNTPKGSATINTYKLNLAEFMSTKAQKRVTFPLNSEVSLDFEGRSAKEWVSGLTGKVNAESEGLVLYGISITNMAKMISNVFLGNLTGTESEDYGKFSLKGSIEEGVLKSDDITLKLADADILAKGKADLVRMTMNFRAVPNPDNKLGFKNPVNIKGSILSPSIIPETTATQKVGAAVGGAVAGPAGAALGGVLGALIENGTPKKDVSKTDVSGDEIMKEKQRLQEEVLKFLQTR
ncbi:MAG: hypothetical protein CFH43_00648 [Proteobacteria bacterium]|nr:MAG: hypothetical protein CFH43_00648 [Pseudomonadota bacterium]